MMKSKMRYDLLDGIRGASLFGIFLANIPFFAGWDFLSPTEKSLIWGAGFFDVLKLLVFDGRFYTIFCFLFGIGLALQFSQMVNNENPVLTKRHFRRMGLLLVIGVLHTFFLWLGDILMLYALLGILLYFVRNLTDKTLLTLASIMLLLPVPGYIVFMYLGIDPDLGFYELSGGVNVFFNTLIENKTTDSLLLFFQSNVTVGFVKFGYYLDTWRIPKVLGIMLIGLWFGRQIINGRLSHLQVPFRRYAGMMLMVGCCASIVYAILGGLHAFGPYTSKGLLAIIIYPFAAFCMGFAYIGGFTLLWLKSDRILHLFVAPGRMALTNYLTQTLISIAVFYEIGLGLGTKGAPWSLLILGILIVTCQTIISNIWLSYFSYGPLEWVWRMFTYGKWIKLKKQSLEYAGTVSGR